MLNSLNSMIKKKLITMAALFVAIAAFTVTSSNALTSSQVREIKSTVLSVPVPEMPAKAAELVSLAQKKDQQAVAVTVVRAVVSKHQAAAPLVVSAISKVAPELAPVVALAAAEIAKDQTKMIARAAAIAAPAQARQIASVVPNGAVATRGAASPGGPTSGQVDVSTETISGGEFPNEDPAAAPAPVVTDYQTPQP